jgi:hypothetical protein
MQTHPERYMSYSSGHLGCHGADVAQLVELQISNLNVASSSLVVRSISSIGPAAAVDLPAGHSGAPGHRPPYRAQAAIIGLNNRGRIQW